MKLISKAISVVFHPLFIVSYLLFILLLINPYSFGIQDEKGLGLVVISVVFLSVFFPLFAILVLRSLGLVKSLNMENKMERIGPLIISGIFYLWLFINIRNNNVFPEVFRMIVLGATIGLFSAFFINNFTKISLHAVGMGGLLCSLFLIRYSFSYHEFVISFLGNKYLVHTDLLLLCGVFVTGLVGTARLHLKAHSLNDIYGGYIVGFLAQIIALKFIG